MLSYSRYICRGEICYQGFSDVADKILRVCERTYLFDAFDGVVTRYREFEEDPSRQQEVHHDLVVPLPLPFLLHPILPRGHGDGLSFTVSSSAAHQNTSQPSTQGKHTARVNMSTINLCSVSVCCLLLNPLNNPCAAHE